MATDLRFCLLHLLNHLKVVDFGGENAARVRRTVLFRFLPVGVETLKHICAPGQARGPSLVVQDLLHICQLLQAL